MDKLERALEKARLLRKEGASEMGAAQLNEHHGAIPKVTEPAVKAARVGGYQTREVVVDKEILERNRLVARQTRNRNADTFRILRTKVLQKMTANNWRTIAVTSPNFGDGKTTTALNLALSLALDVKQTVLLVDLDLRNPDIHNYLGITPTTGLSDYLLHDTPISDCFVKPPFDRVVVLPINENIEHSSEHLASPQMAKLAHELSTRYSDRIVIYDLPPLLTQDDTLAFLPYVDAVLLVVRDGSTESEEVKQCMHQLSDANLLGVVLNNSTETSSK